MSGMRGIYTLLLYLLLPCVLLRLAWRARRQSAYLEHVPERFGYCTETPGAPLIWLHAVSVGETRAAEPLVQALRARYPQHRILLTHMAPTGREAGEQIFGGDIARCYLPYDYPGAVRRFLGHFRPRIGIVMETEIWPNLIHACGASRVPLYLVNARLSEKSFLRYRRYPGLARESLGGLAAIAAQGGDDARRLNALGASHVTVTGNLKFDIEPPRDELERGAAWRAGHMTDRPVLLAASTRDGEEELLLSALPDAAVPGLLVVIVPRHPQRFEEVARLLEARSIRFQRRSGNAPIAPETRVVLGDSMGELFAYYAACDVAFVGGSLLPFGCHNLIEACAAGKPVLIGPSTYNFAEAAELAVQVGAARQSPDAKTLVREAARLLQNRPEAQRMARAALAFCAAHRGATGRTLDLLKF